MAFLRSAALLVSAGLVAQAASAQTLERDLGDFDLKLGTTPNRTMAQGLVTPTGGAASSFRGGLDLSHDSGFYFGQWSPSLGLSESNELEVDSYAGFKKPFDKTLGYEVGLIRYSYPSAEHLDTHQLYAGLRVFENRIGAAFATDAGSRDSTLFVDFGGVGSLLGLGLRMQYANHQLDSPALIGDGSMVRTYNDWSLNLSRPWLGIDMNLIYSDSSLSGDRCTAYGGHNPDCEATVMLKAVRALF